MNRVKRLCVVLVLGLITLPGIKAQNFAKNELVQPEGAAFELIHLHLIKTSFLKGERIWFKAYVFDKTTQLPSSETTNLHVGLYDSEGTEVKRKLIYVSDGVGQGDFEVDSTLTGSMYYIRAWTNWMKNFERDYAFYEQIEILDFQGSNLDNSSGDPDLSIEIFPEGGALLADTNNSVGIKLNYRERGSFLAHEAVLMNNYGDTLINPIQINEDGFGKFIFRHDSGTDYFIQVRLPYGNKIQKKLPVAAPSGIGLRVNTIHPTAIQVEILTNDITRAAYSGMQIELHIQGQDYSQRLPILLSQIREQLSLQRENLPFGLYQIFLRDSQGRVLAQRSFFNGAKRASSPINVETKLNDTKDSLEVRLTLKENTEEQFYMSAAFLPKKTKIYQPSNSLCSSFYLAPHLQQIIPLPRKYFKQSDRNSQYELDMLMLSDAIDHNPLKGNTNVQESSARHEWESGITVKGWAKNADLEKESSVWMFSESLQNSFFGFLKPDKRFESSAILFENDSIAFSLLDKSGEMRKPQIDFSLEPRHSAEKLDIDKIKIYPRKQFNAPEENWINPYEIGDQTIELDEVEVTERRIPTRFQVAATIEVRTITDEDVKRRRTVLQYIQKLGFKVYLQGNRYVITWFTNPEIARWVPVIVNGMVETSPNVLQIPLSRVASIAYDPQGFIAVNLIEGSRIGGFNKETYSKFLIENGFSKPSLFQLPTYLNFESDFFSYFGIMDWNPTIVVAPTQPYTYTIPVLGQDKAVLEIEGMGSAGTLISETIEIDLK